jgi:hypothetical protein
VTSEDTVRRLMVDLHAGIAEASADLVARIQSRDSFADLCYPPGASLTSAELEDLQSPSFAEAVPPALQKVVADSMAAVLFRVFTIMDGVGDPEDGRDDLWLGVSLIDRADDDDTMLHDQFHETFWDYADGVESV